MPTLEYLRSEIERMRSQVSRQRKEILQLQRAGLSTASAETLLGRMLSKVDDLCAERDRQVLAAKQSPTYTCGKPIRGTRQTEGCDGQPSAVSCAGGDGGGGAMFSREDANGLSVCSVPHREDLHQRPYQYAEQFLTRDEARRIAKAISRLPELLKRPQY
jgi:hypothetical protein